nr:MAG TPA: hypothetical protein [Caudoviricetes sp.]
MTRVISPTTWRDDLVLQYSWAAPYSSNRHHGEYQPVKKRKIILPLFLYCAI